MPSVSLCLLGVATAFWLLLPLVALFDGRQTNRRIWSVMLGLGAFALFGAAACVPWNGGMAFTLARPFLLGTVGFYFHLDMLSAWFLAVIALVSGPIAFYLPAYMDHLKDRTDMRVFWTGLPLLLFSMTLVVLAANVLTFLVGWELMSLSSFLLVVTDHRESATRQAGLIYLGATRVGTAFLAGGFLWGHALTGNWAFQSWHLEGLRALGPGLLLLVGLGIKAGMWPFHLWLPIAHPAAPSPVSALMSGVMVKTAVYMMVRLFLLPPAFVHPAFGYTLLALGAISAFWGVLFALLQHDLKRLLAYHTVENIGLILMGVGGSLVARDLGLATVARIALAAALFHVLNHALFKSLLFLSVGAVDIGTGTRDLERLGGLGKRMEVTFACFVLGSAAICALPPLNGFASEWLLYQSALGLAGSGAAPLGRFLAMLLIGWIALVGALALSCFVKATGVAFLGRPRSHTAEHAQEAPRGMQVAQVSFALLCVGLGLLAPAALRVIHPIVAPLEPGGTSLAAVWTLPTASLVVTLAATIALVALWLGSAERRQPVRTFITWECGFGSLSPRMQTTATSFVQPIARMFGALFQYAVHLHIDGANRRLFPEEIRVEPRTEAILESRVYTPLVRWVSRAGDWVVRLQAGSIHLYLLTMFGTLLLLLAIGGYAR
jgi:hydrogenase-4 component B